MILRAKTILPVTAPPIEDGAVFIDGNKIRALARWKDLRPHLREKVLDLGEVILLPAALGACAYQPLGHACLLEVALPAIP